MKIIGQATVAGQKKRDHVLDAARRRAMHGNRNLIPAGNSTFGGAINIANVALQKNQAAWAGVGEVRLGICSIPASASFPDGKVHPRPMR